MIPISYGIMRNLRYQITFLKSSSQMVSNVTNKGPCSQCSLAKSNTSAVRHGRVQSCMHHEVLGRSSKAYWNATQPQILCCRYCCLKKGQVSTSGDNTITFGDAMIVCALCSPKCSVYLQSRRGKNMNHPRTKCFQHWYTGIQPLLHNRPACMPGGIKH